VKKDIKAWAIVLRKRNFYLSSNGSPWTFATKKEADSFAKNLERHYGELAVPVRVKLRVEVIE